MGVSQPLGRVLAVAALCLAMSGCSGEEPANPQPKATSSSPAVASASTGASASAGAPASAEELAAFLELPSPTPLATAVATIPGASGSGEFEAGILQLRADRDGTFLLWQVRNTDGSGEMPSTAAFWGDDTRTMGVTLIDPVAKARLHPVTWLDSQGQPTGCLCSFVPPGPLSAPGQMTSRFPALDEATQNVQVQIPGFKAITVPVTRS